MTEVRERGRATVPAGPDREAALALDAADPLAGYRGRYLPSGPDVVAYLDGNSLGRPLASIEEVWASFAREQWAARLIRGWEESWLGLPRTVGDALGAAVLGAGPGQTVIADSTTVNFYKAMRAALNLRPGRRRVVLDRDNFPTDRYVAESLARDLDLELVWVQGPPDGGIGVAELAAVLDERTAVLTLSHVAYRSGYLADAAAITAAAHDVGALVVWDQSHSVGVCPIACDAWGVDFAVGCTYKFLGAGPGAPAYLYANARHHAPGGAEINGADIGGAGTGHGPEGGHRPGGAAGAAGAAVAAQRGLDQPIWGWLGRHDAFEMAQDYRPAAGIGAMLSGTPPILGILAVQEGVRVVAEAGLDAIRAKAVALGDFALALTDAWLVPAGFRVASPRDSTRRGGHLSIARADARELCGQLISRGVLPDFRTPDVIRLGLSPLPGSFTELWDALAVLRELA